jgi:hypothetical protein
MYISQIKWALAIVFGLLLTGHSVLAMSKIDLYGHELLLPDVVYSSQNTNACHSNTNLHEIVAGWMENESVDILINRLDAYATELKMDGMAYLMMLNKVANVELPNSSEDCKTLFKYAVLRKKGYDVFVGYTSSSITLYGRTNIMIDNCLFIERGPKKYFDLSFSQQREPSAEQLLVVHHSGVVKPLVMDVIHPPAFSAKQSKRVIPYEYDGMLYFFTAKVNQSLIEYYKELPTIRINTVYLNYGLSESAQQSLVAELKEATASLTEVVAMDFMLRFVQTAFEYRKDEQVYGQEKFSFPEETLMNRYSDCEDKSMLFAVFVNQVLGLKTVALYYEKTNHINVAVETKNASVANFTFNEHPYIVCEPSGKGFAVGESATSVSYANLIDW